MHALTPRTLALLLADDSRLAILGLLRSEGSLCVCELIHALDAPQPRVSQHLARLRSGRAVAVRRIANRSYYGVAADLPAWAGAVLDGYRAGLEAAGHLPRLRARLAGMHDRPPAVAA